MLSYEMEFVTMMPLYVACSYIYTLKSSPTLPTGIRGDHAPPGGLQRLRISRLRAPENRTFPLAASVADFNCQVFRLNIN